MLKERKIKIISISGLDGSGKSTQVEIIKKYLERKGQKVFYFHAVHFSIVNKVVRLLKSPLTFLGFIKEEKDKKAKSVTKANKWMVRFRKFILEIDLGRFDALIRNLEDCEYTYIVSDRYFYDNIINIEYLSAKLDPKFQNKDLLGFKDNIIKPDIAIYMQTEPREIMKRDRAPEQGIVYLELKKKLYDDKKDIINWIVVDGNRKIDTISSEIKEIIKKSNV